MLQAEDYLPIVMMISGLAGMLGAMFAAARGIARWARARGRRPWLWVLLAYAVVNLAIGIARGGGGARAAVTDAGAACAA